MNQLEREYYEQVDRVVFDFRNLINNPPPTMQIRDPNALQEANYYANQAAQRLNNLRMGGALIGPSAGALAGAYYGCYYGPWGALAASIIGAVTGGLVGAGIGCLLLELLELMGKAHFTWERAYGISRTFAN